MTAKLEIELVDAQSVDDVRDVWLDNHERSIAPSLPLVADDERSWRRRRAIYIRRCNRSGDSSSSRGIRDLAVSVMLGNSNAQRLYERRGLSADREDCPT